METNLSRSGRTEPGGKMTARIDVPMTEDEHDDVAFMAKLLDVTKAEYIRNLINRDLYGSIADARKRAGFGRTNLRDEYRMKD